MAVTNKEGQLQIDHSNAIRSKFLRGLILFLLACKIIELAFHGDALFIQNKSIFRMQRQITDNDIKPLLKLTLLTHTSQIITVSIPFFKKFTPSFQLTPNIPAFLPLFHSISLHSKIDQAEIDLKPLLDHLNAEHMLHVQSYLKDNPHVQGNKYALHLQFGQMVVWQNEPNLIYIHFKRLGLLPSQGLSHTNPYIKVYATHGSNWTGKPHHGNESIPIDENMTLTYRSLLDTVTFQIWNQRDKMCECQKFIFELLSTDYLICSLKGQAFKGQLKFKATTPMPIVIVE